MAETLILPLSATYSLPHLGFWGVRYCLIALDCRLWEEILDPLGSIGLESGQRKACKSLPSSLLRKRNEWKHCATVKYRRVDSSSSLLRKRNEWKLERYFHWDLTFVVSSLLRKRNEWKRLDSTVGVPESGLLIASSEAE